MTVIKQHQVNVAELKIANDRPLTLICGPCQIESRAHALECAAAIREITDTLGMPVIFKSSYDKANRSSANAQRGVGIDTGLEILEEIRQNMPVLTDVHTEEQAQRAGAVVDVLQIPAFLCRQTDLLIAAAKTGCAVNVKKGQFLAPWDMANVAAKISGAGNENILLCERGTSFGYNRLVSDMRSLPIMATTGYPVIFDVTHSVQEPGGLGASSGGERIFAPPLARAAVGVGVAGVFIESHPNPDAAPSDGPNMIPLKELSDFLSWLMALDEITKSRQASQT